MPEAILGSYLIKFEGDGRGVEAALKRTESSAAAGAARINNVIKMGVTDAMEKASRAATAAAPKMAGAFKDLTPVLRSANQEAARFSEKIRQGAVVAQGDIKRLIAVEKALEQQIIRTSGAVDKATAGATAGYNRVRQARLAAESAARQQRVLFSNAADRTTESGLRYSSMNDFAIDAARDYGKAGQVVSGLAGNLFIAVAAQKQLSMAAEFYATQVIGSGVLEYWKKVGAEMMAAHHQRLDTNRQNFWDSVLAAGSGDVSGAWRAANQGSNGGPDASGIASNGARIRARSQYVGDEPMAAAIKQYQEIHRQGALRLVQLQLENAQLSGNRAAIVGVNAVMDTMLAQDLRAVQVGKPMIEQILAQTRANRALAQAQADRSRQQQIGNLRLELAQRERNTEAVNQAQVALDKLNAETLRANGYTSAQIAQLQGYEASLRAITEAETAAANQKAVYAAQADVGRQILGLDPDRSRENQASIARALAQQEFEELRVKYAEMVAHKVATAEEGDALIAQSRELLHAKLTAIDAQYSMSWQAVVSRIAADYQASMGTVESLTRTAVGSIDGFLTEVLTPGAISSFEDIENAAGKMLRSIAADIAKLMAQKAVMWLLGQFGGGGSSALMNTTSQAASMWSWANGGIAPGGFLPMQAFATGGVVSRPTIGLVGEGRFNEAVVPLPDGRSIPVEMRSGGRQVVENHVTVQLGHGFMAGIIQAARPSPGEIIMTVGEDILTNGSLRKVIQSTVNS